MVQVSCDGVKFEMVLDKPLSLVPASHLQWNHDVNGFPTLGMVQQGMLGLEGSSRSVASFR